MVIKCLYEPQRASESLYMTELRNMHFIGISMEGGETFENIRITVCL